MGKTTGELKKELQDILEREKWKAYVNGKVEGVLNVLYDLELDKEERLELLSRAVGLSRATSIDFLMPREIEYRIYKRTDLSDDEKEELSTLLSNEAMDDETVMNNPKQTLAFISKFGGEKFVKESLPQVDIWVEKGEDVSMKRVKDWLIEKYELF